MSVFTPFRNKTVVKTVVAVGGAMKLSHMLSSPAGDWAWGDLSVSVSAQQTQRVNVDSVGGSTVTFVPYRCDNSTAILSTVIDVTSTQGEVVQGSTGKIYVCGFTFTSSAAGLSPKWVQGSSADACVTSQADKTANLTFSSFSGMALPNSGFPQFVTSSGVSLCLDVPSSGDLGGFLTYVQST